jgi:DNA-binding YbaB/EbfC family protein
MAKRGGFPGGGIPGNMNNLMKQAQRMQRQLEEQQRALAEKEFSAKAGGGAVEVTVTGEKVLKSIQISPDAADPEDVEMLQDMILAAVNEALKQVDDATQAMMGGMAGGLPGGLGF